MPDFRREALCYDPLHGYMPMVSNEGLASGEVSERQIIDHPAFQRLAGINQLGLAYLVYRGATHRRLEHSLGTVWVAQRMLEALTHNSRKSREVEVKDKWIVGAQPTEAENRSKRTNLATIPASEIKSKIPVWVKCVGCILQALLSSKNVSTYIEN